MNIEAKLWHLEYTQSFNKICALEATSDASERFRAFLSSNMLPQTHILFGLSLFCKLHQYVLIMLYFLSNQNNVM